MNTINSQNSHIPVLLNQAINFLPKKNKLNVIDATYGGGGYSKLILEQKNISHLIGIDRDPSAIKIGKKVNNKNFKIIEGKFSEIDSLVLDYMTYNKIIGFDAIFFDLGLSYNQIKESSRGFSFKFDGPLDMRMDSKGISAYDLINTFDQKKISEIIYNYGEEKFANSIAKKIIQYRKKKKINTTKELSEIINKSIKYKNYKFNKKNPSTKTFQALRIFVNDELREIEEALKKSEKLLVQGGRIIVVSFHSLEDRLVKEFFNHRSGKKWRSSRHYPEPTDTGPISLKIITKKAIRPDKKEVSTNPLSRSARLRVAERTQVKL